MATLYVENVPEDLYEAIRARARADRRSISAEVLSLLKQNVPTAEELSRREKFVEWAHSKRSSASPGAGPFASSEELIREIRGDI